MKAKRNRQYANYRKKNEIPSGEMSTTSWQRKDTTWEVRLRKKHFGGDRIIVGYFKQLCNATAAMDYLDEKLNSKSKRENKAFVNRVIQHVRSSYKYKACKNRRKWERSEIENILKSNSNQE